MESEMYEETCKQIVTGFPNDCLNFYVCGSREMVIFCEEYCVINRLMKKLDYQC